MTHLKPRSHSQEEVVSGFEPSLADSRLTLSGESLQVKSSGDLQCGRDTHCLQCEEKLRWEENQELCSVLPHPDKESKAQKGKVIAKVTQLESDNIVGPGIQLCPTTVETV